MLREARSEELMIVLLKYEDGWRICRPGIPHGPIANRLRQCIIDSRDGAIRSRKRCIYLAISPCLTQPAMIATQRQPEAIPLGASVPALTPHAISVSLPTWRDNVGYEEGDKRVVDRMETGYPRFFIHRSIQKVR